MKGCNCIHSKLTNNRYYITKKKIFVIDNTGRLIKKLELPIQNGDVIGFAFMFYEDEELITIILMRDYYDRQVTLNEQTLEFGTVRLFK